MRVTGCPTGTVAAVLVLIAAAIVALVVAPGAEPEPSGARAARPPGPPPKVFAFVSGLGGEEVRRLERVGTHIDVVAPNWYALDTATGRLRGATGTHVLRAAARQAGVALWPVVNARTSGSRGWERPAVRARIVDGLVEAATGPDATGVSLDMEELRAGQRGAFTALARQAAIRVHAAGRKLAIYVPRPGPGGAAAYDWYALATAADLLLCSGYNEHWSGGPAGPITTTGGFSVVLDEALSLAGPAKAVVTLGAFGYRWKPGHRGSLVSSTQAQRLRHRLDAAVTRSDGSERFQAGSDVVVYETADGLRARAAAARAAGARWLGLFSLGREPAAFWSGLATARDRPAVPRRQDRHDTLSTG